ncbi:MAG: hypothetical protein JSS02_16495 [Planctomycetes bacterium]|nr:hypothetical protein [Planctomycetota bacterium]
MSFRPNSNLGNKAVALLATCLVVLAGAVTCTFIGLSAESAVQRAMSLKWAGIMTVGIVVFLWLIHDGSRENRARLSWSWLSRKRRKKVAYKLEARTPRDSQPAAPQGPPTAESVRNIAAGQNTWVPASTAPPKRRKPPQ